MALCQGRGVEIIVSDRIHLGTASGIHWRDSRRVNLQEPWGCMMTFQDSRTYNWYLKGVLKSRVIVLDASELPDKVEEVKFWQDYAAAAAGPLVFAFFAIGKVVIGNDFE